MKTTLPFFVFLFTCSLIAQNPSVTDVSPVPHSLVAEPNTQIQIDLDTALDPTTVNTGTVMVFGKWSGPMDGTVTLEEGNTRIRFTPARNFFYGEWVNVRLTNAIQSAGGDPMPSGHTFGFWTRTLPGTLQQTFLQEISTELPGEEFIQTYGAYAGDVNNDEYTDLVAITEVGGDIRIFLNDGNGGYGPFTVMDMPASNKPSTNEPGDFDQDGLIDLAIGSTQNDQVSVFMGDADDIFEPEISYTSDMGVRGITVIDLEGDGWDDLMTANRLGSTYSIIRNNGDGTFGTAEVMDAGLEAETCIVATDLNNDGIADVAIGGWNSNNIRAFLNDGTGNFTATTTTALSGSPWMLGMGDLNGDGNGDVVSANSSSGNISVLFGDGAGNLTLDAEYPSGGFSLAIDVGDIDGDGDLDLIASNFSSSDFTLYENDGTGTFINPITYPAPEAGSCALLHDRNNDGTLDITLIDEIEDVIILYGNTDLSIQDQSLASWSIGPNPFGTTLNIDGVEGTYHFQLMDLSGRIFLDRSVDGKQIDLSQLQLSEGSYLARIQQGNRAQVLQLIKKKQ